VLRSGISLCCTEERNFAGGFKWRFATEEEKLTLTNKKKNKKITIATD